MIHKVVICRGHSVIISMPQNSADRPLTDQEKIIIALDDENTDLRNQLDDLVKQLNATKS